MVAEPDTQALVPGKHWVVNLGGFFALSGKFCSGGGSFLRTWGGQRVGRTVGLCAHRVERRAIGRPLLQFLVPAPAGGKGEDAAGRFFLGIRSGLVMALMAVFPVLVLANRGRVAFARGSVAGWAPPGFHSGLADFLLCPGRLALALMPFFGMLVAGIGSPDLAVYRGEAGLRHLRRGLSRSPGDLSDASARPGDDLFLGTAAALALVGFLLLLLG